MFVSLAVFVPLDTGFAAVLTGIEGVNVSCVVTVEPALGVVLVRADAPCGMFPLFVT